MKQLSVKIGFLTFLDGLVQISDRFVFFQNRQVRTEQIAFELTGHAVGQLASKAFPCCGEHHRDL